MPTVKPLYSAIYLSDDLGVRLSVTAGHRDLESAKAAVELWCEEADRDRLPGGEVVVCAAEASRLREVLRWSGGVWLGPVADASRSADQRGPQVESDSGRVVNEAQSAGRRASRPEI